MRTIEALQIDPPRSSRISFGRGTTWTTTTRQRLVNALQTVRENATGRTRVGGVPLDEADLTELIRCIDGQVTA